jgi:hypothetical protein
VLFEDLEQDPLVVLRTLLGALGLRWNESGPQPETAKVNPSSVPRNALARKVARSARLRPIVKRVLPAAVRRAGYEWLLRPDRKPPIEAPAAELLRDLYRDDTVQVEELLGRRVPWSTARGALK